MNFLSLQNELIQNLGNRSVTSGACTTSRIKLWLNNAQIEIISAFQFFQTEKRVSAPMVIGQQVYQLPSDCLAIYALRNESTGRKIRRSHYRKFDNRVTPTGEPFEYIRFGNYFELNSKPTVANTLYLRYAKVITSMSGDSDEPTIFQPWHEGILLGGEVRGWRALRERQNYIETKNEYLSLVRSRQSEWEIEEGDEEFGLELVR